MQGVGNKDPGLLSAKQQHNLQRYKGLVKQDLLDGHGFEIAVLELDRAPGNMYGPRYFRDVCPALRSSGGSLFVLSTGDLDQEWWEQEFHRPLTAQERLVLQGHSRELYYDFYRSSDCVKATSNAFHTLALAMMMQHLCQAALDAGKLQSSNQQAPLQPNEIANPVPCCRCGNSSFQEASENIAQQISSFNFGCIGMKLALPEPCASLWKSTTDSGLRRQQDSTETCRQRCLRVDDIHG